jgi:quinol monooxygenase YgiN
MLIRIVKMEFEPEKVNTFLDLFTATRQKIASFEGCKGVQLMHDVQSKNVFFTYSTWTSENELENYRRSELFKQTWSKTKALFNKKAEAWSLVNIEY